MNPFTQPVAGAEEESCITGDGRSEAGKSEARAEVIVFPSMHRCRADIKSIPIRAVPDSTIKKVAEHSTLSLITVAGIQPNT